MQQSPFIKFTIYVMVFLMSIGFAALVVQPFLSSGSSLTSTDTQGALEERVDEQREFIRKNDCANTKNPPTGDKLDECTEALTTLSAAYRSLAVPSQQQQLDGDFPTDAQRNIDEAIAAAMLAYEVNPNQETTQQYATLLRDTGNAKASIPLWRDLVEQDKEETDYLINLASAQQSDQQLDAAIDTYRLFIKRFPESGQVSNVKDEIKSLREQKESGGAGGLGGGNLPINIG